MNIVNVRVSLTEIQAERLQARLAALSFKVDYREEQHGSSLVAFIGCTTAQEKPLREILHELGPELPD